VGACVAVGAGRVLVDAGDWVAVGGGGEVLVDAVVAEGGGAVAVGGMAVG
jgi:hypothetical protein